jgi:hypothetical protein
MLGVEERVSIGARERVNRSKGPPFVPHARGDNSYSWSPDPELNTGGINEFKSPRIMSSNPLSFRTMRVLVAQGQAYDT